MKINKSSIRIVLMVLAMSLAHSKPAEAIDKTKALFWTSLAGNLLSTVLRKKTCDNKRVNQGLSTFMLLCPLGMLWYDGVSFKEFMADSEKLCWALIKSHSIVCGANLIAIGVAAYNQQSPQAKRRNSTSDHDNSAKTSYV